MINHYSRRRHAPFVLCVAALLLLGTASRTDAQRTTRADRAVNVALVAPSVLHGLRAQVILRGGPAEVATVLLNDADATPADLAAALQRARDLYARNVAPGLIVKADVERAAITAGGDAAFRADADALIAATRRQARSPVRGYGDVRWIRLRSTSLERR
jgi:hypothetical protein